MRGGLVSVDGCVRSFHFVAKGDGTEAPILLPIVPSEFVKRGILAGAIENQVAFISLLKFDFRRGRKSP